MNWPVVTSFPIHWGEMDALGHVNHARFFTWLETARIELLAKLGVLADGPREVGPILAHIECSYLRPVLFPAKVNVGVRVASVGRTSVTMDYAVWTEGNESTPSATARSVVVLVNYTTMSKVEVPEAVRSAISQLG